MLQGAESAAFLHGTGIAGFAAHRTPAYSWRGSFLHSFVLPNADGIGILVAMAEFAICVLPIAGLFIQVVGAIETIRAAGTAPRWTLAACVKGCPLAGLRRAACEQGSGPAVGVTVPARPSAARRVPVRGPPKLPNALDART